MGQPQARPQADGRGGTGAGILAQARADDGIRSEGFPLPQPAQAGFQGRPAESDVGVRFHLRADRRGLAVPVHLCRPVQPPRGRLGGQQHHRPTTCHRRFSERCGEPASGTAAGDSHGSRLPVYLMGFPARGGRHGRNSEHEPPGPRPTTMPAPRRSSRRSRLSASTDCISRPARRPWTRLWHIFCSTTDAVSINPSAT